MPSDTFEDKWISPVERHMGLSFQHELDTVVEQPLASLRCCVNANVYGVEHKLCAGQLGQHDRLSMPIRVMSIRLQVLSGHHIHCSHHIHRILLIRNNHSPSRASHVCRASFLWSHRLCFQLFLPLQRKLRQSKGRIRITKWD